MKIGTMRMDEIVCNAPVEGSVISGTMRAEDLIPAFVAQIRHICSVAPAIVHEADEYMEGARAYEKDATSDAARAWDDEAGSEILSDLFDTLDTLGGDRLTFGAHPGDGSDFGFWEVEED